MLKLVQAIMQRPFPNLVQMQKSTENPVTEELPEPEWFYRKPAQFMADFMTEAVSKRGDCVLYSENGYKCHINRAVLCQTPFLRQLIADGLPQCSCQCSEPLGFLLCGVNEKQLKQIVKFLHTGELLFSSQKEFDDIFQILTESLGFPKTMSTGSGHDLNLLKLGDCMLSGCTEKLPIRDLLDHHKNEIREEIEKVKPLVESNKLVKCIVCRYNINHIGPNGRGLMNLVEEHYNSHLPDIEAYIKETYKKESEECTKLNSNKTETTTKEKQQDNNTTKPLSRENLPKDSERTSPTALFSSDEEAESAQKSISLKLKIKPDAQNPPASVKAKSGSSGGKVKKKKVLKKMAKNAKSKSVNLLKLAREKVTAPTNKSKKEFKSRSRVPSSSSSDENNDAKEPPSKKPKIDHNVRKDIDSDEIDPNAETE